MLIKDIFSQTFQLVKDHKLEILKNTLVPIALLIGFFILFSSKFQGIMTLPKDLIGKALIQTLGENVLYVLLLAFLYIRLIINSYRMAVLGPESVTKFGLYLPGTREIKFLGYGVALGIFYILLMLAFSFLSGLSSGLLGKSAPVIFMAVGFILTLIISTRLYFVFPGIATDDSTRFTESWQMSKGYVLKILVITLLFPFVASFVVNLVIKFIPPLDNFLTYHLTGQLMTWSIYLLFFVFTTMLMGMTFKALKTQTATQAFTA